MTDRVPRTEYSAHFHWDLVSRVTGRPAAGSAGPALAALREEAARDFVRIWDYAFMWETAVDGDTLAATGGRVTRMGSAEYGSDEAGAPRADGRTDFPFLREEEVFALDPLTEYGELRSGDLRAGLEAEYREQVRRYPDTLAMGGVYVTLFSGLVEIFGWEGLLLGLSDPERFEPVVEGYARWVEPWFQAYAESDVPVVMVHDDLCWTSGPVVHPEWYRRSLFPRYRRFLEPLRQAGKKIIFTSDGDWTCFFPDIVNLGFDAVVLEPCADMAAFAAAFGDRCGFVGNADTRALLSGDGEDIDREVRRCMEIGKPYPGFIMAVGNHIPPNTPVDAALRYNESYLRHSRR